MRPTGRGLKTVLPTDPRTHPSGDEHEDTGYRAQALLVKTKAERGYLCLGQSTQHTECGIHFQAPWAFEALARVGGPWPPVRLARAMVTSPVPYRQQSYHCPYSGARGQHRHLVAGLEAVAGPASLFPVFPVTGQHPPYSGPRSAPVALPPAPPSPGPPGQDHAPPARAVSRTFCAGRITHQWVAPDRNGRKAMYALIPLPALLCMQRNHCWVSGTQR